MLRDDYEKMLEAFKQTIDGKPVKLEELCQESLAFFSKVTQTVQTGNEKEKEEALGMMSDLYQNLMKETKKLATATGMSEEQLLAFAENPENFGAEQWKLFQKTRATMSEAGESVTSYLKEIVPGGEGKSGGMPVAGKGAAIKRKRKRPSPSKKQDWLRS